MRPLLTAPVAAAPTGKVLRTLRMGIEGEALTLQAQGGERYACLLQLAGLLLQAEGVCEQSRATAPDAAVARLVPSSAA
jgi:hypothetical protein